MKKRIHGITLIALIITIIILLILASVSIATLVGENGIITRAREAKENTEIAEVIERVQTDILGVQIGNNGNITNEQLKEILERYFDGVPEALPKDLSTLTLKTKSEFHSHEIKISDIYTGKILGDGKTIAEQISATNYGDYINYNVDLDNDNTTNDWRIFYKDGTNVFIIAADYLPGTKLPSATGMKSTTYYPYAAYWPEESDLTRTGSSAIDRSVASKYMLSWLFNNPSSTNNNMKAVAALLDTNAWKIFAEGVPNSEAVGAPTLEMFIASWNAKRYTTLYCNNSTNLGYYVGTDNIPTTATVESESLSNTDGYADTLYFPHTTIYESCNGYWLASPATTESDRFMSVLYNARIGTNGYVNAYMGVRPLVCLPSEVKGTKGVDGVWIIQ